MIRFFKIGDEKGIAELEKECFSSPWSEAAVLESHKNNTVFVVFESEGKILGYAGMQEIPPEGFITNVAVTSSARRKNIGSALVEALAEYSREKGISSISLEVRESNLVAQRLYNKTGFKSVGKRRNFYQNPTEDAIIMTLEGF